MLITSSKISVAPIRPELQKTIGEFVKDNSHQIAVTGEISKALGLSLINGISLTPGVKLEPLPINDEKLSAEQRLKFNKLGVKLAQGVLPQIKSFFPENISPVFEGADIILASDVALNSWLDPERKSVIDPLIKSTRVLVEMCDVLKILYPTLATNPYMNTIGSIVKVGDTVYQIYGEVKKVTTNEEKI